MTNEASGTAARQTGTMRVEDLPGGFPASRTDLVADLDGWVATWEAHVAVATDTRVILALWSVLRSAKNIRRVREDIERLRTTGRVTPPRPRSRAVPVRGR